jgi:uncharacterized protein DUF6988
MLKDGPLRRDINRVLEFRKDLKLSGWKPKVLDHRSAYAASLYEMTSEHVSSVCLLLMYSRTSSAAALLRSCIESAVRATWLLLVASDEAVENVVAERGKDKGWPGLEQMMGAIEGHHKAGGLLRRIFTKTGALNDLTHGGLMQIAHRMGSYAGQDVGPIVSRICLRNAVNALALVTCAFYQESNDLPAIAVVLLRGVALFESFEMAGDVVARGQPTQP